MGEKLPTVTHSGTLRIMGIDLTVHNLDNGRRVIEEEDFRRFMAAMEDPTSPPLTEDDARALAVLCRGNGV